MVEIGTVSEVSKLSIQLSGVFAVVGIGLMYLYIGISNAADTTKVLWASTLSLAVAFIFLVIWTISRDTIRSYEREQKRKMMP